jgi:hypothetical protein
MNKISVFIYTIEKLLTSTIKIDAFLKEFGNVPKILKINNDENKHLFFCCLQQEKFFVETICEKHNYKLCNINNLIEIDENQFNNKYTLMLDYLNRVYYLDNPFSHIGFYNGYKLNKDGYPSDLSGNIIEGEIPFWHL